MFERVEELGGISKIEVPKAQDIEAKVSEVLKP
jgi:hypothetical protein